MGIALAHRGDLADVRATMAIVRVLRNLLVLAALLAAAPALTNIPGFPADGPAQGHGAVLHALACSDSGTFSVVTSDAADDPVGDRYMSV
jgi:hypothetical protein